MMDAKVWSLLMFVGFVIPSLVQAQENFDRLDKADRSVLQERFTKEIWPLMSRNGKDGCLGCHRGGMVTALKLSGDPAKDFQKMLKDGFFLPGDEGSLEGRLTSKNPKRKMPPGKREPWTNAELETLKAFVAEIDRKQAKK